MKNGFRQSMAWLHTWSGLLVGWVLFLVFAAGTAAYWRPEITFWMKPEMHAAALQASAQPATPQQQAERARQAIEWMQANAAGSPRWFITLPSAREPVSTLFWIKPNADPKGARAARFGEAMLDASGQPHASARDTRGGDFLYRLHFDLHYLSPLTARWVVGFCAMFMLVAIISGIVTHKRIFADFFTFRPKKCQRSWLDAHNATAVLALPYHLMITYTGLCTLMFMYMPWAPKAAYGEAGLPAYQAEAFGGRPGNAQPSGEKAPLADVAALVEQAQRRWGGLAGRVAVENPGDAAAVITIARQSDGSEMSLRPPSLRFAGVSGKLLGAAGEEPGAAVHTYNVMEGLHTARFANAPLRWLFFLSGLMGCAMVATGLLLWAVKERPQHLKALKRGEKGSLLLRVVDGLNLGAIGGLLVALPAYFWANRLLPVDLPDRAGAEISLFFAAWGLCLALGLARPSQRLWQALLAVAGALLALMPLLNAATGGAHWGQSIPAGLWRVAGFDAVCLLLGLGLWAAVRWLRQREAAAAAASAKAAARKTASKTASKPASETPKAAPEPPASAAALPAIAPESPATP